MYGIFICPLVASSMTVLFDACKSFSQAVRCLITFTCMYASLAAMLDTVFAAV